MKVFVVKPSLLVKELVCVEHCWAKDEYAESVLCSPKWAIEIQFSKHINFKNILRAIAYADDEQWVYWF